MGMIDRYKKRGGFLQLLNLIETTEKAKAEKFLSMIKEESPLWEQEIRNKLLSIDKILKWDTKFLMEFLPRLTPNVIGCAISQMTPEQKEHFLKGMDFGERKKAEEYLKDAKPNGGEVIASQMKMIQEIRKVVAEGVMKLEKVDPTLGVPDNIEEILSSGGSMLTQLMPAETTSTHTDHPSSQASAAPSGSSNSEEALVLRRKVMALSQENVALKNQVQALQNKLEAIRKAAA